MRRLMGIRPAGRARRKPGRLLGKGGAPVYIALFVVFTGFTLYVTVTSIAEGLYLGGAIGLAVSVGMLWMLYYVIRSRM